MLPFIVFFVIVGLLAIGSAIYLVLLLGSKLLGLLQGESDEDYYPEFDYLDD